MKHITAVCVASCLLTLGLPAHAMPSPSTGGQASEMLSASFQDSYTSDANLGPQLLVTGSFRSSYSWEPSSPEALPLEASSKDSYSGSENLPNAVRAEASPQGAYSRN